MAEEKKESAPLAKPAEFFIGLVDFFAILLPGGLATAICLQLADLDTRFQAIKDKSILSNLPADQHWPLWVAFVVVSYLLGHFIFLVGSVSLDNLYDLTYYMVSKNESKELREHSTRLVKTALGLPENGKIDSIFQWARVFVRLRSPATALEVDRLEADSKFFRSLTVLLFLASYLVPAAVCHSRIGQITAVAVILICFTGAAILGDWRKTDEHAIRVEAYKLYEKRTKKPGPPHTSADDDWDRAKEARTAKKKKVAWAIIVGAILLQFSFCFCFWSWNWFGVQFTSAACLTLSGWRFMERRFKSTVFTYRLLLASRPAPIP
jgi:hypothetical protein